MVSKSWQAVGDWKVKVGVRVWFVKKREMPPFFIDGDKVMTDHEIAQKLPVFKLLFGEVACVISIGASTKEVKWAAHIKRSSSLLIKEGDINSAASAVR